MVQRELLVPKCKGAQRDADKGRAVLPVPLDPLDERLELIGLSVAGDKGELERLERDWIDAKIGLLHTIYSRL